MYTVITEFNLPPGVERAQLVKHLRNSIPVYEGYAGLIRKYISVDMEQGKGCGVYLWSSLEQAEAFYEMARPIMKKEMGHEPVIRFFECPIIVDNEKSEVWVDQDFGA